MKFTRYLKDKEYLNLRSIDKNKDINPRRTYGDLLSKERDIKPLIYLNIVISAIILLLTIIIYSKV